MRLAVSLFRKRAGWIALAMFVAVGSAHAAESDNPHHMTTADGEPDTEKCAGCHADDMSLSRSKLETCTLCHGETPHAGAVQHLRADAAAVARVARERNKDAATLPLTDEGTIYCGTCHIFHDPAVSNEEILPQAWLPAHSGVAQAVRQSLESRWGDAGAKLSTRGTQRLRLRIDDGSLCRHCHGYGK